MTYRISVDTGGTFTDVVVSGGESGLVVGKALTTPARAFDGLSASIADAAGQMDLSLADLLQATTIFIYGTTRATNAIVTKQGAKTAFLTTEGFQDTLVLKEGGKTNPHDFSLRFPEPYVPRRRTFGIIERMTSEGTVHDPLDEAQARAVLAQLRNDGYEAVAVSFLWSIVNPAHELRMGELLAELLPGIPYTLGHQLAPILREYRRASATAIDASLKPLMQDHLGGLEHDLRAAGYASDILVSTSVGGCMHVRELIERPIHTAKSGPAMAPVAARAFSAIEELGGNIIVCDTGGTTFDVGLVVGGSLVHSRDTWLGGEWTGHLLGISSVDIRSVGAGGGSIAWIDDGGLLRVGPQSAGSVPGPACYGRGGAKPTVSDAACVLRYFDPDYFLGGRMTLDVEAARRAVATVADPLGRSVEETAYGILKLASEIMINAVQDITVAKGINPRESVMVAGGGAAGINIMLIAEELGVERVLLPKQASALSASGMQFADIVAEESVSAFTSSRGFDAAAVTGALDGLDARLESFRQGLSADQRASPHHTSYAVEARYASQVWEIEAPVPERDFGKPGALDALVEAFHRTHDRLYALRDEGSAIEFLSWRARLVVESGLRLEPEPEAVTASVPAPDGHHRDCFFGSADPQPTRIYKAGEIRPGMSMQGPCIVEEPTTTVVVFPGMSASVTANGHYLLSFR